LYKLNYNNPTSYELRGNSITAQKLQMKYSAAARPSAFKTQIAPKLMIKKSNKIMISINTHTTTQKYASKGLILLVEHFGKRLKFAVKMKKLLLIPLRPKLYVNHA